MTLTSFTRRAVLPGLIVAALAGCASDVAMVDPNSGRQTVCREPLRGFNPWSQSEACVASLEAAGWIRADGQ